MLVQMEMIVCIMTLVKKMRVGAANLIKESKRVIHLKMRSVSFLYLDNKTQCSIICEQKHMKKTELGIY